MERKTLLRIGIPVVGALAVANLLYFWLAPDVACKMLVYYFCFGVILLHGITSVVLWRFFGPQKATPMVVSGSAFGLGIFAAGGIMLTLDAPFRTALYFLIIFSVLYLICAGYLSCIAADALWTQDENAVAAPPTPRRSLRDWFSSLHTVFRRRRPQASDTEHHVRNGREVNPAHVPSPPQTPAGPPPLPERQA